MANGVVLKDGLNKFKADRGLVSESLLYVAKISKGLHSGVLNEDPDFVKFQQESMDGLVKKETDKLCDTVVLGAEQMLAKISATVVSERAIKDSYIYARHTSQEVEPILLTAEEAAADKDGKTGAVGDMIKDRGNELASMSKEEVSYLKEVNKESAKVAKLRAKIRKDILNKTIKKKAKKKVAKKKTSKKKVVKNKVRGNKK